ncbi:polysaccharide export outer membrane protein [Flavobacterium aquidurense]|uniref:Sugar transporter n=1 Tax=Flavobacterium frigidimaris TaxID=262320 RepID=A0ABX4BNR0_FLAFR|nr:polysaccharide biosynthesis/export family protein [Flavobacterium frigidimaris]OXA77575.1 sugar transporter [Flavobacterium frigidimaris]SDY89367.1 polysaccharide export outer membrane protein [Flavobacterium aquidurense]
MKSKTSFIKISSIVLLLFLCLSCGSKQDVVYYQNIDSMAAQQNSNSYEIKIQPDDLLMIIVSADDPEVAIPFNLRTYSISTNNRLDIAQGQQTVQLYLVDQSGNIEFPVVGKLKLGGLTRTEALQLLQTKIGVYIKNPIVNLRITNFKVSLQGEVNLPGTYPIASERVTLVEALSMAKDLTIYGKRDNILVIRETNGVKSYNRVDITKSDFINSPFYYLAQNDVVYVEPNKTRINSSAVGPNTSVIISAISILVSLSVLIFK